MSRPCPLGRAPRHLAAAVLLLVALSVAALTLVGARPARAQAPITFTSANVENLFPAGMNFQIEVHGAGDIVAAALVFRVEGDPAGAGARVTLPLQPGPVVALRYTWDPRPSALPPGAVIAYHWEATDAAGTQASSAPGRFTYQDTRFRWQTRQSEAAVVWTHDLPDAVADRALELANQAVEHQHRVFQASLPGPVQIRLYNTYDELAAWEPALPAFSAGRAFPGLGITAQVALPGVAQGDWLAAVIPHEIARLYFYQATAGTVVAPAWLDEGLALYNEAGDHRDEQRLLQAAVVRRDLLPLAGLAPAFAGSEEGRVRLAQAEALSAVNYLMFDDGPDRLAALLAAYREGLGTDAAFAKTLERTPDEFEDAWLMWLGVPAVWRQRPTPAPVEVAQHAALATPSPGPAEPAPAPTSAPGFPPSSLLVAILLVALFFPALAARRRS